MSSRPRRSAAARANEVISVHAKWADTSERSERSTMSSRRSGRTSGAAASSSTAAARGAPDSPGELSVEVKTRQAPSGSGRRGNPFEGGEIVHGKRNRGGKKSYVVDSSPDDEEDEEEEAEIEEEEEEDDDLEDGEEDAEGEDDMEVDAEGEEDADGDIDMDVTPSVIRPTIKVSRQARPAQASRAQVVADDDDDDDDEELSDPGMSDVGDTTMGFGDETMADEDAEGEEIEVAGEEEDEEEEDAEGEAESDEEGSQGGTPDVAKMTKRQRARFEDEPQEYMKLSDEVQVKKHFTAEELSMRRQEMARRRRNLSEKRNEEVKMETINKLLKKQAPKVNRKAAAAAAAAENGEDTGDRPDALFIRWVSKKDGSTVSVPEGIAAGPAGAVFRKGGLSRGKMVEEVA